MRFTFTQFTQFTQFTHFTQTTQYTQFATVTLTLHSSVLKHTNVSVMIINQYI